MPVWTGGRLDISVVDLPTWLKKSCVVYRLVRPISCPICVKVFPLASLAASSWLTSSGFPVVRGTIAMMLGHGLTQSVEGPYQLCTTW